MSSLLVQYLVYCCHFLFCYSLPMYPGYPVHLFFCFRFYLNRQARTINTHKNLRILEGAQTLDSHVQRLEFSLAAFARHQVWQEDAKHDVCIFALSWTWSFYSLPLQRDPLELQPDQRWQILNPDSYFRWRTMDFLIDFLAGCFFSFHAPLLLSPYDSNVDRSAIRWLRSVRWQWHEPQLLSGVTDANAAACVVTVPSGARNIQEEY